MSWIQTYTGKRFSLLDPTPEQIDVLDIAHALSNICRFTGHCNRHYSVASHSIHASYRVPARLGLQALLHDASEAYYGDVASPLKRTGAFEGYRHMEKRLQEMIFTKYGAESILDKEVKYVDLKLLKTEARDLLSKPPVEWDCKLTPYDDLHIAGGTPVKEVEIKFLTRFNQLVADELKVRIPD